MGSLNTSVPVGKAKKPSLAQSKAPRNKPIQAKKPEPLYHLIGKERVKFIKLARQFSEDLRHLYGDEMSITKFGRILVELKGQKALDDLIHLDQSMLDQFHAYQLAKRAMIEEQNSFKSSFSTPLIESDLPLEKERLLSAETRPIADNTATLQPFLGGTGGAQNAGASR
jgi:hypothetical protein